MPRLILDCDAPTYAALLALLSTHPGVTIVAGADAAPAAAGGQDAGPAPKSEEARPRPAVRVRPAPGAAQPERPAPGATPVASAPSETPSAQTTLSPETPEWLVTPSNITELPVDGPIQPIRLKIATDGSSSGNPGPIGMGLAIINAKTGKPSLALGWGGGEGTNHAAELSAVVSALNLAAHRRAKEIEILTDSEYVSHGVTKWAPIHAKAPLRDTLANHDLWRALLNIRADLERHGARITVTWVRSHEGHPGNEWADRQAVKARKQQVYIKTEFPKA